MRIEYGTSSSNLNQKKYFTDGGLTAPTGTYSVNVVSLEANTTYYYRAVIQFGDKEYSGSVESFKTSAAQSVTTTGWLELPAGTAGSNQYRGAFGSGSSRNYSYLYDKTTYSSLWSAYPLIGAHFSGTQSAENWAYNPNIAEDYQVNVLKNSYGTNYEGASSYSRGHLVAAADRKTVASDRNQTYYVTNQVPQWQSGFNSGVWSSLEDDLRKLVDSSTDTLYIVTGPAYQKVGGSETIKYLDAKSTSIKPSRIPLPTYMWKAILKVKRTNGTVTSASAIGFWFTNESHTGGTYTSFIQTVDQIEQWTGFDLFANLPDSIEATAEANSDWTTFKNF